MPSYAILVETSQYAAQLASVIDAGTPQAAVDAFGSGHPSDDQRRVWVVDVADLSVFDVTTQTVVTQQVVHTPQATSVPVQDALTIPAGD